MGVSSRRSRESRASVHDDGQQPEGENALVEEAGHDPRGVRGRREGQPTQKRNIHEERQPVEHTWVLCQRLAHKYGEEDAGG